MNKLREGLPPLPKRMRGRPINDKGYPIPYFVGYVDGKPDFRAADPEKRDKCMRFHRCWLCGEPLGRRFAFVVGPVSAVSRVSAEPPSHIDCAEFAVRACPFMLLPKAQRREANLPEGANDGPGLLLDRNPGVVLMWISETYGLRRATNGVLMTLHDPLELRCYTEGRTSTPDEVRDSIESGLSVPAQMAFEDHDWSSFTRDVEAASKLLGVPITIPRPHRPEPPLQPYQRKVIETLAASKEGVVVLPRPSMVALGAALALSQQPKEPK